MAHLSNVKYGSGDWRNNKTDAVAVGIYEDLKMSRQIQGVNRELGRGISNALSANLLKGKIGEVKIIIGKKGNLAFVFGLGKVGNLVPETLRKAAAGVSKLCISNSVSSVSFLIPKEAKDDYISQAAAEGLVLGSYQFNEFKTTGEEPFNIKSAIILGGNKKAITKGVIIAEGVCLARNLENRPGNVSTPSHLADHAKKINSADHIRTIRALEVFYITGKPLSSQKVQKPPNWKILELGLNRDNLKDHQKYFVQYSQMNKTKYAKIFFRLLMRLRAMLQIKRDGHVLFSQYLQRML